MGGFSSWSNLAKEQKTEGCARTTVYGADPVQTTWMRDLIRESGPGADSLAKRMKRNRDS